MMIKLNGKNSSLRDLMEREGFRFPCGGKGLCGRCKIVAPNFKPTDRDLRFLSTEEISAGVRLACDKTLDGEAEIDCLFAREENKAERMEYADAYAVFTDYGTFIGLAADGEVKDSVFLEPTVAEHFTLAGKAQREVVELIERHSVAKAGVMLLAADAKRFHALTGINEPMPSGDNADASLFNMPADEVYIPPIYGGFAGGDLALELYGRERGEMVVAGGYFAYIGAASVHTAYISLAPESLNAYKATAEYFLRRFAPVKRTLIGENAVVSARGGFVPEASKIPVNAAAALDSNRVKAALRRLVAKTECESLADDDIWQECLNEVANG